MGKLIGYGKLGRSMPLTLEKCGSLGGDAEPIATLKILAERHPDDYFYVIGRNSGEDPTGVRLPPNVINPWMWWGFELKKRIAAAGLRGVPLTSDRQLEVKQIFDDITLDFIQKLDGIVMWMGQHGTSNSPLPKVDDPMTLTKPQEWCVWYASYLLHGINAFRDADPWSREEVYLNADPRNYHKLRDLKWPLRNPVLTQYKFTNTIKHHRYDDTRYPAHTHKWERYATSLNDHTWGANVHNVYSRLEVSGTLPGTPFGDLLTFNDDWNRPGSFGLFINETRKIGVHPDRGRLRAVKEWVLPLDSHFIHGKWSDDSLAELGVSIQPSKLHRYNDLIHSVRCTFTAPSSGSGWATAKPWEAFATGTVCFFHPDYDTQNHILVDAGDTLNEWLRVNTPQQLGRRVKYLNSAAGKTFWHALVKLQRAHFERAIEELKFIKMIEERIW